MLIVPPATNLSETDMKAPDEVAKNNCNHSNNKMLMLVKQNTHTNLRVLTEAKNLSEADIKPTDEVANNNDYNTE
jgi:hypothetical protein